MSGLERAFEDSLRRMAAGESTLNECLDRYPRYAEKLAVLLEAAASFKVVSDPRLSAAGRVRGRNRLLAHMAAHPRTPKVRPLVLRMASPRRWATALAALVLALGAGTTVAQSAAPGELLYPWRQTSEALWLRLNPNHQSAALAISSRRTQDLLDTMPGTPAFEQSLKSYQSWIQLMQADGLVDAATQPILEQQRQRLRSAGIDVPEVDQILGRGPSSVHPTPTPQPQTTLTVHPVPTSTTAAPTRGQQAEPKSGTQKPGPSTPSSDTGKKGHNSH